MTESELIDIWNKEKPIYEAWGDFISTAILNGIEQLDIDPNVLIKIPAKYRLKSNESLIDKAFYRPEKNYSDPYNQIEDKIGLRFVVLLIEDINLICSIVENSIHWTFDRCRHFDEEKKANPMLFTYQSVHYILRPKKPLSHNGCDLPKELPCELQIRTLLQHAHAELTHDALYKTKQKINPIVQRTVAKSMALIETTDGFFSEATKQLNFGPLEENNVVDRLNGIYQSTVGLKPHVQKSSLAIWDEFEQFIDPTLVDQIAEYLHKNNDIAEIIKKRYAEHSIYQQSIVLFIYWLLSKKRQRLLRDWPLSQDIIEHLATDIGVSLHN
jgi:ppGpp synthetase/RelA/SpoT-type nucleotidyltranferase